MHFVTGELYPGGDPVRLVVRSAAVSIWHPAVQPTGKKIVLFITFTIQVKHKSVIVKGPIQTISCKQYYFKFLLRVQYITQMSQFTLPLKCVKK